MKVLQVDGRKLYVDQVDVKTGDWLFVQIEGKSKIATIQSIEGNCIEISYLGVTVGSDVEKVE
jgi:hypothetical protein